MLLVSHSFTHIRFQLYTRSYELFKKYSPSSGTNLGRQTLWIAYRIARTYHDSGKFDMAVKSDTSTFYRYIHDLCFCRFFERIAKTYRRENWDTMLRPLLTTWYACAQQLGDMELGVQLLVEMLAHGTLLLYHLFQIDPSWYIRGHGRRRRTGCDTRRFIGRTQSAFTLLQ